MDFGDKIKQIRIKRNLTQEEVALRCDLSKGFISQIERDLTSPSIATLVDILDCLGTNLKDFFNDFDNNKIVFHKEDIFLSENTELGFDISWLIPNAQKNDMEPILLRLKQGGRSDEYLPFLGEIFGYVLSGAAVLHFGSDTQKIKKGESFYYKANSTYYFENASKGDTVIILVSTPPNF